MTVVPTTVPKANPEPGTRNPERAAGALTLRVVSGLFAIPFLLGLAFLGDPYYGAFICLACAYAAFELRGMLRAGGYSVHDLTLFGVAVLLPLDAWLRPDAGWPIGADGLLVLVVIIIGGLVTLLFRPTLEGALVGWALSLGLALYVGGLMQFYFPLRGLAVSSIPGFWVMALLILSWVCDSAAYFVGGAIGRTRLAPAISPRKSVEGAVAGLLAASIAGPLLGLLDGQSPALMAGYGLAIALATIVGDLVESLIKRQTGVKDSGGLIPGHGGLLDRMDSLLLCAPIAVLYLRAVHVF